MLFTGSNFQQTPQCAAAADLTSEQVGFTKTGKRFALKSCPAKHWQTIASVHLYSGGKNHALQ